MPSRTEYTICIRPPGKYSNKMSRPMPEVNNFTSSVLSKRAGSPRVQSAPSTGPATVPRPPMMVVATTRIDAAGSYCVSGVTFVNNVAWSAPASPAMPPAMPNAVSLMRVGDTVDAAAMSSFSRTAMSERPRPVRRRRATMIDNNARMIRQK